MSKVLDRQVHSPDLPGTYEVTGDSVKVLLAIALLAVLLSVVLLGSETNAMSTIARSFCIITTAIFACAATVGLASRSRI
jgi:hypothetical protein